MAAVVKSSERRLRFLCPEHKVEVEGLGGGRVVCAHGPHVIAERFPQSEVWGYCCDCGFFSQSALGRGGEAPEQCGVCQRVTARRFVCAHCEVVSFESDEGVRRRDYAFADGEVRPACPGCDRRAAAPLLYHDCEVAKAGFKTARAECPFCHEAVVELPAFPALLAGYLGRVEALRVAKVSARLNPEKKTLEPSDEGRLLLIKTGASRLAVVLPRYGRLKSKQEFLDHLAKCYDCATPAAGEVYVQYPATAERVKDGWRLKEVGRLEVKVALEASPTSAAAATPTRPHAPPDSTPARPEPARPEPAPKRPATKAGPPYPVPAEPEPEPEPAAEGVEVSPDADTSGAVGQRLGAWKVILALVLIGGGILWAVLIRTGWASADGAVRRAVARGQLVRPEGYSARDLYRQLKQSGAGGSTLASLDREILSKLVAEAQQVLDDFAEPGNPDPGLARWQEVSEMLEWAGELSPGDSTVAARAAYCKGRVAYLQENKTSALDYWKRAGEMDKSWALPPNGVGLIYNEQRNYNTARTYLFEAARRAPNWAVAYNNIGTSYYYGSKDYRQAAGYYRKAVECAPRWARPHAWLGDIAMRDHDYPAAAREFEIVLNSSTVGTANMDLDKIRQQLTLARQAQGQ